MLEKKKIFNLIIVDASGSMGSKIPEVTGGLNQLFAQIRKDEQENEGIENITTVVDFSSSGDFNVLIDRKTSDQLIDLKEGDYKTKGMTALYDAIGKSFLLAPNDVENVFVSIFTDGEENDSKEFKSQTVKDLILKMEAKGWTITFMGTTQAAMLSAQAIGIRVQNSAMYHDSKEGSSRAFSRMTEAKRRYSTAVMEKRAPIDLFKDDGPADDQ